MQTRQRRVLLAVLAINVVTFVMMVLGSLLSGSSALLSGTLDNFGDAVTYGLSFAVVGATGAAKARVALFKGILILAAAVAVAIQIGSRLANVEAPIVETMSAAALLNLAANAGCLWLLTPYRSGDVNMGVLPQRRRRRRGRDRCRGCGMGVRVRLAGPHRGRPAARRVRAFGRTSAA
jgi:Co/Zn/Cd efflux system component